MRHQTVRQVKLTLLYMLLLQAQQPFVLSSVLSDHVNSLKLKLKSVNTRNLAVDWHHNQVQHLMFLVQLHKSQQSDRRG